jgi:hypothetical protein
MSKEPTEIEKDTLVRGIKSILIEREESFCAESVNCFRQESFAF